MTMKSQAGQAMVEYVVVLVAVLVVLLAPFPGPGDPSVLARLSQSIQKAFQDYSWSLSIPS